MKYNRINKIFFPCYYKNKQEYNKLHAYAEFKIQILKYSRCFKLDLEVKKNKIFFFKLSG